MAYINGKKTFVPLQLHESTEIEDGSVTTAKLADGAVTEEKLEQTLALKLDTIEIDDLVITYTNTTYTKTATTLVVNRIDGTVENIEPYVLFSNLSINVTQTPVNSQHFIIAETANGIVFVNGIGNIFYTPKTTKTFTKLRNTAYTINAPINITITENDVTINGTTTIVITDTTINEFLTSKNINETVSRMVIGYSGSTAEPPSTLYYSIPTTDISKKLRGKVWNVLGDSITAERAAIPTKYYNYISTRQGGVTVNNYGIGSTCICASGGDTCDPTQAFCVRYSQMAASADIITVLGGVNDFGRAAPSPLGTYGDTVTTTFYGALDVLCQGLIDRYPNATIMFMTPMDAVYDGWASRITDGKNALGLAITDYADAIKKVCRKYAIPVLDLGGEVGFTPYNATQKSTYYVDGLHPNVTGHLKMSYPIENKLLELYNE